MEIDYKKLIEALELIQEICKQCRHCCNCPMGSIKGGCVISEEDPSDWNISKPIIRVLSK